MLKKTSPLIWHFQFWHVVITALSLALIVPSIFAQSGTNLLGNPGFETASSDGWATKWSRSAVTPTYSRSTSKFRTGTASLTITKSSTATGAVCSQSFNLSKRGGRYQMSAWIKTENVTAGSLGGATIALEWYRSDGSSGYEYMAGRYVYGQKDTNNGWVQVSLISSILPPDAVRLAAICYLRSDAIGTAYWDDVEVSEYREPYVWGVITNAYRNELASSSFQARCGISRDQYNRLPSQVSNTFRLYNASNTLLQTVAGREACPKAANHSFEDGNQSSGVPIGWSASTGTYTTVADGSGFEGNRYLTYSNTDSTIYRVCTSSSFVAVPGQTLWLQARLRSSNNVTPGTSGVGASIALEWYDSAGTFVSGGAYPKGLTGNNSTWQTLHCSVVTPATAATGRVICYLGRGATGTADWDSVMISEDSSLFRPYAVANFSNLTWANGGHTVVCTANDTSTGAELDTANGALLKLSSLPSRVSQIEAVSKRFMIKSNGTDTPFFPIGMYYNDSLSVANLRVYAEGRTSGESSSLNFMMSYQLLTLANLNTIQTELPSVKVFRSFKDYYYNSKAQVSPPSGLNSESDELTLISSEVSTLKAHPSLLGWYNYDEFPVEDRSRPIAHQYWFEDNEATYFTLGAHYLEDDLKLFQPASDALAPDPYPIKTDNSLLETASSVYRKALEAYLGLRPFIGVVQAHNVEIYDTQKTALRAPTISELRNLTWQSIAAGGSGVLFYSFRDVRNDPDDLAPNDGYSEGWANVKQVSWELANFKSIFLSSASPPRLASVAAPTSVSWRTFSHGGFTYLALVNAHPTQSTTSRFTFTNTFGAIASMIWSTNNATLDAARSASITVPLGAREVKFIKLTP
jgi:hypothetical protein